MKILDRFILKSYLWPLLRSFIVILFLLVLQFLSMYKDDLFGKGISTWVLIQIFAYASASLVILALPASILLSSLFTMGSMGEHYETAAFRSSGVNLPRVMRPMLAATVVIAIGSFLTSVFVVPVANLKFYSLVYDIRQVKPTLTLKPGHFYNGIEGYTIRISDKNVKRDILYDVMIYDHTVMEASQEPLKVRQVAVMDADGKTRTGGVARMGTNNRVILADSGRMVIAPDGNFMRMTLFHGVSHEALSGSAQAPLAGRREVKDQATLEDRYARYYFDTLVYNFDLTAFAMKRTDEKEFATHHYMLNLTQLMDGIDSIRGIEDSITSRMHNATSHAIYMDTATTGTDEDCGPYFTGKDPVGDMLKTNRREILYAAVASASEVRKKTKTAVKLMREQEIALRNFSIEYHSKYSLPLACIVFLMIGAPLGSIIRKGGIGLPILFSMVFFVLFYVLLLQGKKLAREGVMEPWVGVWLPLFVMTPIGIFITHEATNGARIMNARVWWLVWTRVSAVLWYLNPLRFLVTFRLFRRGLIALLEFLLSLSPKEIRHRRAVRRRAQSMRIQRGDKVEYVDRKKK